jgi:hypothetical protein
VRRALLGRMKLSSTGTIGCTDWLCRRIPRSVATKRV